MSSFINIDSMADPENLVGLLDHLYDLVMVVDRESRIIYANRSFKKLVGREELEGELVSEIEPASKFLKVLQEGKPLLKQRQIIETAGLEVNINYFPLIKEGSVEGAVGIGRLISADSIYRKLLGHGLQHPVNPPCRIKDNLPQPFKELTGVAPAFVKVLHRGAAVARNDVNVLLLGESGTGKEIVSRAIHQSGERNSRRFVVFNCAAIPENLLESELFGYIPGAFTGASNQGKRGKLEEAHGGTLLLDEIGDLPLSLQAKILRVLQFKTFEKVGGTVPVQVDVRIIAATNKDLWKMVKKGELREDLYYRLNVYPIKVPSLRERKVDIKELARLFLGSLSSKYQFPGPLELDRAVERQLWWHDWPGNVRELENVIEHAFVMALSEEKGRLLLRHLPSYIKKDSLPSSDGSGLNSSKVEDRGLSLREVVEWHEMDLIARLLEKYGDDKKAVRKKLGISKGAFYHKLNKYGLI